jgi:phosphohistidine phosphatase SixA
MQLWLARCAETYLDRDDLPESRRTESLTDHGRFESRHLAHIIKKAFAQDAFFDFIGNAPNIGARETAHIVAITFGFNRFGLVEGPLFGDQHGEEQDAELLVRAKESIRVIGELGVQQALVVSGPNYLNAMQRHVNPLEEPRFVPIGGFVQLEAC